jgi:hypothetical protein
MLYLACSPRALSRIADGKATDDKCSAKSVAGARGTSPSIQDVLTVILPRRLRGPECRPCGMHIMDVTSAADIDAAALPAPPMPSGGIVRLPAHAREVTDADEEVFLLYTGLAALGPAGQDTPGASAFRGLGFLDAATDLLPVRLEIAPRHGQHATDASSSTRPTGRNRARRKGRKEEKRNVVLEWELWQDKTALRSRAGDTGSVLWRARCALPQHAHMYPLYPLPCLQSSIPWPCYFLLRVSPPRPSLPSSSIDFAAFVLQQTHFPYPDSLLDPTRLATAHALELGSAAPRPFPSPSPLTRPQRRHRPSRRGARPALPALHRDRPAGAAPAAA